VPLEWFEAFIALGFINLCINPLLYAARYDVFRKSLNKVLRKNNAAAVMPMSAASKP